MTLKKINQYLTSKLKIDFIKIYDDSHFHHYSKKNLTHLKMIIVSNNFMRRSMISRHRMIFSMLSEITKQKIYSITLNTYTFNEWKSKKNKKISVAKCLKKNNILSDC